MNKQIHEQNRNSEKTNLTNYSQRQKKKKPTKPPRTTGMLPVQEKGERKKINPRT